MQNVLLIPLGHIPGHTIHLFNHISKEITKKSVSFIYYLLKRKSHDWCHFARAIATNIVVS